MSNDSPFDKFDRFAIALRVYLDDLNIPWWHLRTRIRRRRYIRWAELCASQMWPMWYEAAIQCGGKPEDLEAMALLFEIRMPIDDWQPRYWYNLRG